MLKQNVWMVVIALCLLVLFSNFAFCQIDTIFLIKAKEIINTIPDNKVRLELLKNLYLGNYPDLTAVGNAAQAYFYEHYYDGTENLTGNKLRRKLKQIISKHKCLGYKYARRVMYSYIDNEGGYCECVYTGRKFKYPQAHSALGAFVKPKEKSKAKEKGFMNCEHTWPQSFFNKKEPMRSDIFHLFPTDSHANSIRGSFPFGYVKRDIDWQKGGSKRGRDYAGRIVFEPRDCHKGNVARAMFYFATCYGYKIKNFEESVLREWHKLDPVDEKERQRNEKIFEVQQNRNPYIDHPEFVDKIKDF